MCVSTSICSSTLSWPTYPTFLSTNTIPTGNAVQNSCQYTKQWWTSSAMGEVSRTTLWTYGSPLRTVPSSTFARDGYRSLRFSLTARPFLSIQASSASTERQFGDAGYQKGTRRQATGSSVAEMLLMVRSCVFTQIKSPPKQDRFISSRAQPVKRARSVHSDRI